MGSTSDPRARFARRWLSIASTVCLGVGTLAAGTTSVAAAARPKAAAPLFSSAGLGARPQPHAATRTATHGSVPQPKTIVGPTCNDQWNVVQSGNAGTDANNELNSVSAISATDAWAVGDFETGSLQNPVRQPQAQHWDGGSWTLPTAQPTIASASTGDNLLLSVTAVTTTNIWAVGFAKPDNGTTTLRQVLIEHYDGTSWTAIPDSSTNNPIGTSNALFGIKFFSATDIWAVGDARASSTAATPLIEHYDGTSWTIKTGATTSGFALLSDVLPLSATDVWAAGSQGSQVLLEHYDGTAWSQPALPLAPTGLFQFLSDVAGVANDLWAVGGQSSSSTTDSTLTMHYDGTSWTYVASPTPDLSANLIGVRYAASNDVWAVGGAAYSAPATANELDHTVIEHWDGNSWRQVRSPNPSNHQDLFDVALAGSNLLLTVGFSQDAIAGAASTNLSAALCEPTPAVTGLNPDHGNSGGGTTVKIAGTGLAFPRAVTFGGVAATSFVASSDTQITAVAPAEAVGSVVDVAVTTMGGTSPTSAGDQYTAFGPGPWENAGGVLASGPVASTWGSGRLDAFVTGTDGVIYHRFLDAGTWAWEALPGEASTSDASSVSTASGSIDVFIRGADKALWHRAFTGGNWTPAWQRIGGVLASAPSAVSIGGGIIAVFVQGTDNHLWVVSLNGTTVTWQLAGGVLAAGPSAVSAATGTGDAFVMGSDGALWHWSSAAGGTWTGLGGHLAAKPAATTRGTTLDVFVEGTDIGLWHWTNAGGGSAWEGLGGKLGAAPAAVSWASTRLDVFVRGTDSGLYHAWSDASAAITTWRWEGVGGKMVGSPAAVTWGANRLDAFVRGTDNHLWHLPFD